MGAVRLLHELLQDGAGVTAIEYALLGSLIAMAIIIGTTTLGLELEDLFDDVAGSVQCVISGVGCP